MDAKKTTFTDVQTFIWNATEEQCRTMSELIRDRWNRIAHERQRTAASRFAPGDTVFFLKGKRSPRVIAGTLVRVTDKVAYLATPDFVPGRHDHNWRVSPSLLQHHTPGR